MEVVSQPRPNALRSRMGLTSRLVDSCRFASSPFASQFTEPQATTGATGTRSVSLGTDSLHSRCGCIVRYRCRIRHRAPVIRVVRPPSTHLRKLSRARVPSPRPPEVAPVRVHRVGPMRRVLPGRTLPKTHTIRRMRRCTTQVPRAAQRHRRPGLGHMACEQRGGARRAKGHSRRSQEHLQPRRHPPRLAHPQFPALPYSRALQ